jgi:6-pyruvoyltetrahydropterin/6-carboxytetrahydropterin synthase
MAVQYSVRVEAFFESAHFLRSYKGKPEPLHGHSWKAEVEIEAPALDREGMAVDFIEVKQALLEITQKLDYSCINDVPPFTDWTPSAENIARWICEEMNRSVGRKGVRIAEVRVFEGRNGSAAYRPAGN